MRITPRKLLICLAVLPAWLVLIELGYRGWRSISGKTYHAADVHAALLSGASKLVEPIMDPTHTEAQLHDAAAASLATLAPHPYTGVEAISAFDFFVRDAEFCRRDRNPNEYVVLLLGGSVATQFSPEGSDVVCERLALDPRFKAKHVSVFNYARAGTKQPQQVMMAAWLFSADFHPDAVISLDGYNETALFAYNVTAGAHPLYPFFAQWGHVARAQQDDPQGLDALLGIRALQKEGWNAARRALDFHLYESSVLGQLTIMQLMHIRSEIADAQRAYGASIARRATNAPILGPPHPTDAKSLEQMMVRGWVESSLSLHGMCNERGIFYLHVLQPTLHDLGSKPLTQAEIENGKLTPELMKGVQDGYPKLREASRELRANGVNFLDASYTFAGVTDPIYYDFCHFKGLGNRLLGAKIAEGFLQALPTREAQADSARPK